jgi:hypothetical protein
VSVRLRSNRWPSIVAIATYGVDLVTAKLLDRRLSGRATTRCCSARCLGS